jgi:hypothetical protein
MGLAATSHEVLDTGQSAWSSRKAATVQLRAALEHVFDAPGSPALVDAHGAVCFEALEQLVRRRAEELGCGGAAGMTPQPPEQGGREGPLPVRLDRAALVGELRLTGNAAESWSNFGSGRAATVVSRGQWMFEAVLGTPGIMQLGWATAAAPFTNEEGVGDWPDTYAFDGRRVRKWNVTSAAPRATESLVTQSYA